MAVSRVLKQGASTSPTEEDAPARADCRIDSSIKSKENTKNSFMA
jgi:hypothetical protein